MLEFHRDAGMVKFYLRNGRSFCEGNMAWLSFWQHDPQEAIIVNCLDLIVSYVKRQLQR